MTGSRYATSIRSDDTIMARLFAAVEAGDAAGVRAALKDGADVNAADLQLELRTPLNVAVERGDVATARLLLGRGAKIERGAFSNIAYAFEREDLRMLELLVRARGDANDLMDQEDPPWKTGGAVPDTSLLRAVRQGRHKVAKKLLDLGADPNRLDDRGFCALAVALLRGDKKMQKLLAPATDPALREQASRAFNVAAVRERQDGFVEAVKKDDFEKVQTLLKEGINPDASGERYVEPAAIHAAWRGKLPMVKLLVEAGASPHGNNEWPLIVFAARGGNTEVVNYLLDLGADINAVDGDLGPPILDAAGAGDVAMVRLLLERGADPSCANGYGRTALSLLEKQRRGPIWAEKPESYEQVERIVKDAVTRHAHD